MTPDSAPAPRLVTYSMAVSLDGYVMDATGGFDWSRPEPDVFAAHLEDLRTTGGHLVGRRLYETMLFWEDGEDPDLDDAEREWARLWQALPKTVFSRTLDRVEGSSTLATRTPQEEVAHWRSTPGTGDLAVGGADLAAGLAALDLVDEYRPYVVPVLVGGGTPFFRPGLPQTRLQPVGSRTFSDGTVATRYRVLR